MGVALGKVPRKRGFLCVFCLAVATLLLLLVMLKGWSEMCVGVLERLVCWVWCLQDIKESKRKLELE